jgi:hypothetical protein
MESFQTWPSRTTRGLVQGRRWQKGGFGRRWECSLDLSSQFHFLSRPVPPLFVNRESGLIWVVGKTDGWWLVDWLAGWTDKTIHERLRYRRYSRLETTSSIFSYLSQSDRPPTFTYFANPSEGCLRWTPPETRNRDWTQTVGKPFFPSLPLLSIFFFFSWATFAQRILVRPIAKCYIWHSLATVSPNPGEWEDDGSHPA